VSVRRRVDVCSLVSGAAIAALGILLWLAADGRIDLGFEEFMPAVLAAAGAALLTSGLRRQEGD